MKSCPSPNVGNLERTACLAVGALFLVRGILSGRVSSTVLGGLFAYRGLSGQCCGYRACGIDTRSAAEKAEG